MITQRESTQVRRKQIVSAALLFFSMTQGLVNLWALSHYEIDLQEKYKSLWSVYCQTILVSPAVK